nr:hypothetical protein [uncultured Dyadobacter sp.]
MQTHNPPSFLQQYGSWIGYAAAASVTSVMAYMYVNQLSQNDHLMRDVKNLQSQIEVIRNQPAVTVKTDTVYVLQKAPDSDQFQVQPLAEVPYRGNASQQTAGITADDQPALNAHNSIREQNIVTDVNPSAIATVERPAENFRRTSKPENGSLAFQPVNDRQVNDLQGGATVQQINTQQNPVTPDNAPGAGTKTFGGNLLLTEIDNPVEMNIERSLNRQMNYELANRLSSRQVQRALLATSVQPTKATAAGKKGEQVAQAENVVPKLPLKVPYRFGAGYQLEGNGQGKTVLGEVIVNKKFSIAAGITWLKAKPAEFFSEKIFREKNRRDFKTTHPGEVPLIFELYNIKIDQTVVQMPLTLAFRNTLKNDWAYYASMGTNIKISSKETISYDCRGPKNEFFNQKFSKKGDVSPITSMNFALGIEKTWYPIVVQAEGYWVNYFKPLTPLSHSAGPGLKVKLMYQIGRQM